MHSRNDKLENRVAIVTGGASGIGRALCEQLAAGGAFVIVADINGDGAREVASAIQRHQGRVEAVPLDVSRAPNVEALVSDVVATRQRLDYMFNNS